MSKATPQPTPENAVLETFENPNPSRDYIIRIETPEFTCLCPKTGQPDFATIRLEYVPAEHCIELKALKLYYWSYRNEGAFHEAVTNKILEDLVAAIDIQEATLMDMRIQGKETDQNERDTPEKI